MQRDRRYILDCRRLSLSFWPIDKAEVRGYYTGSFRRLFHSRANFLRQISNQIESTHYCRRISFVVVIEVPAPVQARTVDGI